MTFRPNGSSHKKNKNSYAVEIDKSKLYERPSVAKKGDIIGHTQKLQQRKQSLASGLVRDKNYSTFAQPSRGLTRTEELHFEHMNERVKSSTKYIRKTLRKEDGFTKETVSRRDGSE